MKDAPEVIENPTVTATAPALGALLHHGKHFFVHLLVDVLAPEEIKVDKFGDVLFVDHVGDTGQGDVHVFRGWDPVLASIPGCQWGFHVLQLIEGRSGLEDRKEVKGKTKIQSVAWWLLGISPLSQGIEEELSPQSLTMPWAPVLFTRWSRSHHWVTFLIRKLWTCFPI